MPPVPAGDVNIPLVSDALNTLEWLNNYEGFYQKRCAHRSHDAKFMM